MLSHLSLNNLVLISELDLTINSGLCVITGETGAGKSIILTALGLVTGARVQPRLIGQSSDRAQVSAAFDLPPQHPGQNILENQDLGPVRELILRRTISKDGRTRAFINGQQVPVAILNNLGATLVEIQGQFDQLAILNAKNHRALMDSALGLQDLLTELAGKHAAREAAEAALRSETKRLARLSEDQDYLQHCLQELDEADLVEGEVDVLHERRLLLRNLYDASESLGQLHKLLTSDRGLIDQLVTTTKLANRLPQDLATDMAAMINNLDQAWNAGENAATELRKKLHDLEGVEEGLEEASQRLFLLKDLARKHECDAKSLIETRERIRQTLTELNQGQIHLKSLTETLKSSQQAYLQAAQALSKARHVGGKQLSDDVNAELPDLHLPEARVSFDISGEPDMTAGPMGYDHVRLLVQTNRGSAPGYLEKTASGGELSRILLALKLALAPKSGPGPLMVFDEADAGIGGATATALGTRLRRLGKTSQVLAVTHSPQLAAAGDWHLKVTKLHNKNRSGSHIRVLNSEERTQEIARMLAGTHVGEAAYKAALALQKEFA